MTTILLSGRNPFSFSMPTLTSVSMEALPVMRPITGSPPPPPPRRDSSSSAEMKIIQVLEYLNEKLFDNNIFIMCVRCSCSMDISIHHI